MSDDQKKKADDAKAAQKAMQLKWNQFFKDAFTESGPMPSCSIQKEIWLREKEAIQNAAKMVKFDLVHSGSNISYMLCKEEVSKKTIEEWRAIWHANIMNRRVKQ